jgi:hypothetical protein
MMNSPAAADLMAFKIRDNERARLTDQDANNIHRLIAYNNRRIRAGLHPLAIPRQLAGNWFKPATRDFCHFTDQ